MKKLLWTVAASLLTGIATVKAQGINFDSGSWKEVLAKAKEQNKLVFIDVYTSWCGPCKKMVAEVFPLKEVGGKFNGDFVNFSIDAEKGEGIEIATTFNVRAFPTYLFVNGDGQLIYRSIGYKEANPFLKDANIALKEQADPKPFAKWEDEYNTSKRDKNFLIGYLKKRAILKLSSADIIEEIFPLLAQKDLADKELVSSMLYYDPNIGYLPKGKWYNYVVQHSVELDSMLGKRKNRSLELLNMGIDGYFKNDIIVNHKEELLPVMIKAKSQLQLLLSYDDKWLSAKELTMNYYSGTNNPKKLIPAVLDYVNNGLMKMDITAMQQEDAVDYQKMLEPYTSGKVDSTKEINWEFMNRFEGKKRMISFSYHLRGAAEVVYKNVKDKKILAQAAAWAKQACDYFSHFSCESVYAGLLMKTGKKQEAVAMMQKASADPGLSINEELRNMIIANVEKIKAGVAPEYLWHR